VSALNQCAVQCSPVQCRIPDPVSRSGGCGWGRSCKGCSGPTPVAVQCSGVQCSAVQSSAEYPIQCLEVEDVGGGEVARAAVVPHLWQCSVVQCSAAHCSAVQCSAVQRTAVQCSAVQCTPYVSTCVYLSSSIILLLDT
jgi:hypothetical protein